MEVTLHGELDGEPASLALADLSDDVTDNRMALRFRYFQSVEGELSLPTGFSPETVAVEARATTPRKMEVREEFPWQVQEKFTHVGK